MPNFTLKGNKPADVIECSIDLDDGDLNVVLTVNGDSETIIWLSDGTGQLYVPKLSAPFARWLRAAGVEVDKDDRVIVSP